MHMKIHAIHTLLHVFAHIYIHLYVTYIQTCRSLPFMLFVDVFIHAWVQIGINPTHWYHLCAHMHTDTFVPQIYKTDRGPHTHLQLVGNKGKSKRKILEILPPAVSLMGFCPLLCHAYKALLVQTVLACHE